MSFKSNKLERERLERRTKVYVDTKLKDIKKTLQNELLGYVPVEDFKTHCKEITEIVNNQNNITDIIVTKVDTITKDAKSSYNLLNEQCDYLMKENVLLHDKIYQLNMIVYSILAFHIVKLFI